MSFNTIIDWNTCSDAQQRELLMRPAISASESITRTVAEILDNVKARGDDALREYSAKFDKTEVGALQVTEQEIIDASNRLGDDIKQAMAVAVKNIDTFHTAQKLQAVDGNPARRALPAGDATGGVRRPLYSRRLCSAVFDRPDAGHPGTYCRLSEGGALPPPIADEILYAAKLCGVQAIYKVGGAQAISARRSGQ